MITIHNKNIGDKQPTFIIAEIGVNHNGDINLAKRMIDAAIETGADAVKFQSYQTDQIITQTAEGAAYHLRAMGESEESWYSLLKRLELSKNDHEEIIQYCTDKGIIFLSTPYDTQSADLLNEFGVEAFKIASTDLNNVPLLKHVARFQKPILLSTGMSTLDEIRESFDAIIEEKNERVVLLHCTSNYPPQAEDINLNVIENFKKEFQCLVGYSDHLAKPSVAVAAVAKGACVYETHFTTDKNLPGPDQECSLEPEELKEIIEQIRFTEKILGSDQKNITPSEEETRLKLRKSLVALCDIQSGDIISQDNVGIKRPGTGLAPKHYFDVMNKPAVRQILKDQLIQLEDIEKDS